MQTNYSPYFLIVFVVLAFVTTFATLQFIGFFHFNESGFLIDRGGYVLGRDFLNFWQYGQAFWSEENPAIYYDRDTYNHHLAVFLGEEYPGQRWSYMPHTFLLAAPFGLLGYNLAYMIFTVAGLFSFYYCGVRQLKDRVLIGLAFTLPLAVLTIMSGQFSFFVVSIFAFIYFYGDERPILSAVLIAILTIKPQLGLVIPVYLIATQRYKIFIYSCILIAVFLLSSVLVLGVEVWEAYFHSAGEQYEVLAASHPLILGLMPTLTVQLTLMEVDLNLASTIHALFSIVIMGLSFVLFRNIKDGLPCFVVLVACSFVVSPYLMIYDGLLLFLTGLYVLQRFDTSLIFKALFVICLTLQVTGPVIAVMNGFSLSFLFILFAGCLVWEAALKDNLRILKPSLN